MIIKVFKDKRSLADAAAEQAARHIRDAISTNGGARIIAATGASQFEFLDALTAAPDVHWKRVEMFHLDEYIGLPLSHPASFRKYLLERLINKTGIRKYHFLEGDGDVPAMIPQRISKPKSRILSLTSTRPVAASRWANRGSLNFRKFPGVRLQCPCV